MAVTTAVLSGNIADLGLDIASNYLARVILVIESNTTGSLLRDTDGNTLLAGAKRVTIDRTTGAYSQELVTTDSTDILPADDRLYQATLIYPSGHPGRGNVTLRSGWFELTDDASLSDPDIWQGIEVTAVSSAVYESITALRDETQALRDGIVGDLGTTDSQTATLINSPGSLTEDALNAAITAETDPIQAQVDDLAVSGTLEILGAWDSGTAYATRALVTHGGGTWVANAATLAAEEPGVSAKWTSLPTAPVATASVDGLMPAADKALIDTVTPLPNPSVLVKRRTDGHLSGPGAPTDVGHYTRKDYVDGQIDAKHVTTTLASEDLNTVLTTGVRHRTSDVSATPERHYPEMKAGVLDTQAVAGGSNVVHQTYKTREGHTWTRRYDGIGTWTIWQKAAIANYDPSVEAVLQQEFRLAHGGVIGTDGKGAIAFRFDHWLNALNTTVWPLHVARLLPGGVCVYSDMLNTLSPVVDSDSTAVTWTALQTLCIEQGLEIWSHGQTHRDIPGGTIAEEDTYGYVSGEQGLYNEIVQSKADLETAMPKVKIAGWMMPGVSIRGGNPHPYIDFDTGSPLGYDTRAGRLIRRTYPVSEAYTGGLVRALPTGPLHGANHPTAESTTLVELKKYVDRAVEEKIGVEFMVHAGLLDQPGYLTVADYTAFLDYVVTKRDAGQLAVVTPSSLYVADPAYPGPHDLIRNGSFAAPFNKDTNPGSWSTNVNLTTVVTDAHGTWLRTDGASTIVNQTLADLIRNGYAGETWRIKMRCRPVGATGTARLTVSDPADSTKINKTWTKALTGGAGGAGTWFEAQFTIPKTSNSVRAYFGRSVSGIDITDCEVTKV